MSSTNTDFGIVEGTVLTAEKGTTKLTHLNTTHGLKEGDRLLRLTDQIMDLRKIDRGKMELNCTDVALSPFVKGVVAYTEDIAQSRRQTLTFTDKTNGRINVMLDTDCFEKILLNLLRGTGLRGLTGMQPKHDSIIRPLLCLSREEILEYLESKGQDFVTDSTNSERIAQRNRLRLDVIPLLRDINPAAVEHLCLASEIVQHSLPYYIKGIESAFEEFGITETSFPLVALSSQTLLHEWLAGKGFNAAQEEEMLGSSTSQVGKVWHSNTYKVLRDREVLIVAPLKESSLPELKQEIVSEMQEQGPNVAYFDADSITKPVEVRPICEGDAFVPFGMTGRKLVSDFLTDRKLNRFEKAETFVATQGDDIIWLIGYRSDNRYRVTDTTRRIRKLSVVC